MTVPLMVCDKAVSFSSFIGFVGYLSAHVGEGEQARMVPLPDTKVSPN
ncbi:MAG: hypothetical protein JO333_19150 [Verrucomicrobia bacterium]|nr:hypothetical protein [Verrucomicrobiota bacterium]